MSHILFNVCLKVLTLPWCSSSSGPVRPRPGAVPLQRREHDGVQTAQHRQPPGGVGGGAVGHGAAAGSLQSWDWNDGGDDDSELTFQCFMFSLPFVCLLVCEQDYAKSLDLLNLNVVS